MPLHFYLFHFFNCTILKTKLFALLVGIDKYHGQIVIDNMATFPPLGGCVNDVTRIKAWLAKDPNLDLKLEMLTDEAATKAAIVEKFEKHLGKATKDDAVLFYYSGHGTVERADKTVWTTEQDGRLEGIVCHYTEKKSGKFLLADKELRYLLNRLSTKTKAHIVAIFDCCHSGDNTRAAAGSGTDVIIKKQVEFKRDANAKGEEFLTFPQRDWADFVFAKEFPPSAFKGKFLDDVMPPGRYVQIAACESNESALEVNGSGVLTAHLLDALNNTGGNLTYNDLVSRVRNAIRYRFGQRPRLYTPDEHADLAETGFLKKPAGTTSSQATLQYNLASEFRINRGSTHHVEPGVTTIAVKGKDGKEVIGYVTDTTLDTATVKFATSGDLAKVERIDQTVTLNNLANRVVRVQLDNRDLSDKDLDALLKVLNDKENAPYIALENDPKKADYTLLCWCGMYYITKPGDIFRPLVMPVMSKMSESDKLIINHLRHISQWKFVEQLENKGKNALPAHFLKTEIFAVDADGKEIPLAEKNGQLPVKLYSSPNPDGPGIRWSGAIKIKVTNNSSADMYVAAAYLSNDFSCNVTALLDPQVVMLEPKQSKWIRDHKGGAVKLKLDESTRLFNRLSNDEILKIVYSSESFEVGGLKLGGLPTPDNIITKNRSGLDDEGEEDRAAKAVIRGWNAYNMRLSIENPLYNKIDQAELKSYIQKDSSPETAHFIMGLYFENTGLGRTLKLKPGLTESGQKGAILDTVISGANTWANFWRNRDYANAAEKYPGRPKLVSEGDSWFQHPIITDIIDHVSKFYPIHCLAAAGDTLRNWVKDGKVMLAVETVNPDALLLSGGGNDILGESMRSFLADTFEDAPEGTRPERFFLPKFAQELDALADIYRTVFAFFKQSRPKMPIIVHGYDYPRPLPADSKKTSWLGVYFTEKKNLREKDRTAAVRFMMDEFNRRLKAVAAEYPDTVHYLDLRGIVRDDQWADEIHPNDDGYQDIATVYVRTISDLLEKKKE